MRRTDKPRGHDDSRVFLLSRFVPPSSDDFIYPSRPLAPRSHIFVHPLAVCRHCLCLFLGACWRCLCSNRPVEDTSSDEDQVTDVEAESDSAWGELDEHEEGSEEETGDQQEQEQHATVELGKAASDTSRFLRAAKNGINKQRRSFSSSPMKLRVSHGVNTALLGLFFATLMVVVMAVCFYVCTSYFKC